MGWFGWGRRKPENVVEKDTSNHPFWREFFGMKSVAGVNVNSSTAMQSSAVFACVRMLSQDLAKLKPKVEAVYADGTRLQNRTHALARLMRRPNSWQTWFEFVTQMQTALVLRGNAYAAIVYDERGEAHSFVPLNPDSVALWESTDGSLWWHVSRSGYHETAQLAEYGMLIPAARVLHLTDMRPTSGIQGLETIFSARESVGLSLAQEQLASRWVGNGARPAGIIVSDKRMSTDEMNRAYAAWKGLHSGVANAGKTAVFENGLKWIPLELKASDLEFLASRRYQLEEIARLFRIPLHMLGAAGDKNTAAKTTDKAGQDYVNLTLSTYTEIWKQKLEWVFGLDLDTTDELALEVGWDYSILLQADLPTRVMTAKQAVAGQLWTPNEGRIYTGVNPLTNDPEADKRVVPPGAGEFGSDVSGDAPDDAGRPKEGEEDA